MLVLLIRFHVFQIIFACVFTIENVAKPRATNKLISYFLLCDEAHDIDCKIVLHSSMIISIKYFIQYLQTFYFLIDVFTV